MNTNDDSPSARAAGLKTLAAKALLTKLQQHSAFQLDFSTRCDRLIAIRAALREREALPAETAAELIWRYVEAALAVSVLPSATKTDLARKVTVIGPMSREFLPPVNAALLANAVIAAMMADGQFQGVRLEIQAEPPSSPGSLN
ncbi:hypothetical protein [Rhabdaerophilum sp. SD176]|uniref:hypothetical protein n=1 Tax=Rhabdaerophilum sp. SD176 TaxID=2983548 RepID=UPI0024DFCC07|nr:hypothetical protein [Rhabdaerophilum sp. SD176]